MWLVLACAAVVRVSKQDATEAAGELLVEVTAEEPVSAAAQVDAEGSGAVAVERSGAVGSVQTLLAGVYSAVTSMYKNSTSSVAERLASKLGYALGPELGKGFSGTVYGLKGAGLGGGLAGNVVLKVHDGGFRVGQKGFQLDPVERAEREALLGEAVPPACRVRRTLAHAAASSVLGELQERVDGGEATAYGGPALAGAAEAAVLAGDLALALHSLHTKIAGHTVLHCDLALKNVLVSGPPGARRATLVDLGDAIVQPHGAAGAPAAFPAISAHNHCRATSWVDWFHHRHERAVPYAANVEWRSLALLLYRLVEHGEGPSVDEECCNNELFAAAKTTCRDAAEPYRCAAERSLAASTKLGPLKALVADLLFDHEAITDEREQVLRHPALAHLNLAERADAIPVVEPSAAFRQVPWALAQGRL